MNRIMPLLVVTLLTLGSSSPSYATTISFIFGGLGGATNINNGNAFNIPLTNNAATDVFLNNTGKTIKDFHFVWTNNQNNVIGEDDFVAGGTQSPAFGSFTAAATALDFFDMPGGTGIGNGGKFSISLAGFTNNNMVMANATFNGGMGANSTKAPFGPIPEPGSIVLLGTAIIGLFGISCAHGKRSRVSHATGQ
jgi:hypothetical protein